MAVKKKTTKRRTATKAVAKRSSKSALALPADLADEFGDAISRDRATVVAATGWPIIRVSAGGFSLGGEPLPSPLPLIVLGGVRQNILYEGAYNPSSPSLPSCAAVDTEGDESTMAPPAGVGKSDFCVTCDFNAWGSGAGRGKACKNQLKLAVFPYDPNIDYTKGGRGAILNLPPTALKLWAEYASRVTEDIGRPLFSAVTNFEVRTLSQGFTIEPSFSVPLNDVEVLRTLNARAEDDALKVLHQLPPIDEDAEPSAAPKKGGVKRKKIQR